MATFVKRFAHESSGTRLRAGEGVLLDECADRALRATSSVMRSGLSVRWAGTAINNGELPALAAQELDAFATGDRNL